MVLVLCLRVACGELVCSLGCRFAVDYGVL